MPTNHEHDHGHDHDHEHDHDLDEDFPLGDGNAAVEGTVFCPYCGEPNEISLDPGGGSSQQYVEDCQVCCQPWNVSVTYAADGSAFVEVNAADA
jgi:hypothetical protein